MAKKNPKWYTFFNFIKHNYLILFILLLSSFIYCTNLGGQYFTNDEPETVMFGNTILKSGLPLAWDGHFFHSGSNGLDFRIIDGYYLWSYHPWLQFYLAALGLLLGSSPADVRLPFALFGVATVLIIYFISREIFKNRFVSLLVCLQLIFLMPFFLFMRQVRYYSPDVFFYVVLLWLIIRLQKKLWNKKEYYFFAAAGLLLFLSDYVTWVSFLLFIIGYLLWKRLMDKKLIGIILLQILFAGIWYLMLQPYHGQLLIKQGENNLFLHAVQYLSYINSFLFPFILLPFVFLLAWRRNSFRLMVSWIAANLLVYIIFLEPQGRYLVDITPVLILFYGYLYSYLFAFKKTDTLQRLGYAAVTVIFLTTVTSNILGQLPWMMIKPSHTKLNTYPEEFYDELTGYYPNMIQPISKYLLKDYKPGDIFWSNKFKIGLYLQTGIPPLSDFCDTQTHNFVGPNHDTNLNKIEWFIFFKYNVRQIQTLSKLPCLGQKWQEKLGSRYKKKQFTPVNVYSLNDTDIVSHVFPPLKASDDQVVIYEKK
jgi:Dolichyl-phosphate-mannose-protein mannosyltransferase